MGRPPLVPLVLLLLAPLGLLASAGPALAGAAPTDGFGWPVRGTPAVERPFDPPRTAYGAGHRGVDLQADLGDDVVAAGAGQVTYAGLLAGRGVVAVTHPNGLRTTYEPVTPSVRVGQKVDRGALLGTVATGHLACGGPTCLHWGLRRGETYLDPLALLDPRPLRLLPLRPGLPGGSAGRAAPRAVAQASAAPVPLHEAPLTGPGAPSAPAGTPAALAVSSLLAGLLVLRSRRLRAPAGPAPPVPLAAGLVDLTAERSRRRPAS